MLKKNQSFAILQHVQYFNEDIIADGIRGEHPANADVTEFFLFLKLEKGCQLGAEKVGDNTAADAFEIADEIRNQGIFRAGAHPRCDMREEKEKHRSGYADDRYGDHVERENAPGAF